MFLTVYQRYDDFVSDLTAGLYGHSHPVLQKALSDAIHGVGTNLGGTTRYEQQYASLLCKRFDLDLLRFSNSGTEANMHALAAARHFTGRRKTIVFRGGYHGSVLAFANGIAANNVDPKDWLLCQYNDIVDLEKTFEEHDDIAAVIVEGVQGSGGAIRATTEFLQKISDLTSKVWELLILCLHLTFLTERCRLYSGRSHDVSPGPERSKRSSEFRT